MSTSNNLEIKGTLREFPLAELLIEISQTRLNGSLRLNCESQKAVVYFDAGEVVFAVSNARAFRLSEMLLRDNKLTKEQLLKFSDAANDLLLGQNLVKDDLLSKPEVDRLFTNQIEAVLTNAFEWNEGDWIFSPLVRVKGDIRFKIESNRLLIKYARNLTDEVVAERFKNLNEVFLVKPTMPVNINLSTHESFVFSRFETSALNVEDARFLSGLSAAETLKILYTLWLGGFLSRRSWNTAFSDKKTSEILSAKISLVKGQKTSVFNQTASLQRHEPEKPRKIEKPFEKPVPVEEKLSLDKYLEQVENSANFYEMLDVEPKAAQTEIKQAYFSRAKLFHPDLFHKEADMLLRQRVQQAFGKIAQAYDTLRYEKNREVYDFKMRKELEAAKKRPKTNYSTENANLQKNQEQASDDFEQGFSLLLEEEFEAAIPYLARAVHLASNNARFHAYYGKALAADKNQRHKAEAELQTAVRLDESNPDYRLMLAEFFVQNGLSKRAEGELNRLLAAFPDNRDARILLDTLRKK
jgi:DnaJ-domain-containing protein 1